MPQPPATTGSAEAAWLGPMDEIAEEDGYLERLGARHWAFFAETGPQLLVTFERAEDIRARDSRLPAAWDLCRAQNWSLLTIIAEGETFWRDTRVWGYFDRLIDDAFFDDFDQVLFHGTGPGGYAAASYVVAAPGARALLISPLATLSPALTGWDRRYLPQRRLDFTSRYGFGPDMTEGVDRLWLVCDPLAREDAAHAALYGRAWAQPLFARHTGPLTAKVLQDTGILGPLLVDAMTGQLSPGRFGRLWRARKQHPDYLRGLLDAAYAANRPDLEIRICRDVVKRLKSRHFGQRLKELTGSDSPG